jgi:hypothetical protein
MKALFVILAFAIISCNKENSTKMSEAQTLPLKSIPTAIANGKTITLTADKSTGPITSYGWALDVSSPTYADQSNPVTFSNGIFSHKGPDFISITVTVGKAGKYAFSLIVYDADKNQNYNTVEVEVN